MDAKDYIEKRQKEAKKLVNEASVTESLQSKFPDLKIHKNRWGKERYHSEQINAVADSCDICHNCGCCNDSPLEVWPYKKIGDQKVYSTPPVFFVGERNGYYNYDYDPRSEVADSDWYLRLREKGISEKVIERVASYFRGCGEDPGDWEKEDDS